MYSIPTCLSGREGGRVGVVVEMVKVREEKEEREERNNHWCVLENGACLKFLYSLLLRLCLTEWGSHRRARLGDVHSLFLSLWIISYHTVLRVNTTLVLMAPYHEVKECWNEVLWNVVGLSMLGPKQSTCLHKVHTFLTLSIRYAVYGAVYSVLCMGYTEWFWEFFHSICLGKDRCQYKCIHMYGTQTAGNIGGSYYTCI